MEYGTWSVYKKPFSVVHKNLEVHCNQEDHKNSPTYRQCYQRNHNHPWSHREATSDTFPTAIPKWTNPSKFRHRTPNNNVKIYYLYMMVT